MTMDTIDLSKMEQFNTVAASATTVRHGTASVPHPELGSQQLLPTASVMIHFHRGTARHGEVLDAAAIDGLIDQLTEAQERLSMGRVNEAPPAPVGGTKSPTDPYEAPITTGGTEVKTDPSEG
jgi:hypothetical protein